MQNNNERMTVYLRRTLAVSMLLPLALLMGGCEAKSPSTSATVELGAAGAEQAVSSQEKETTTADQVSSAQPEKTTATAEQMHLGKNVFRACAACHQFDGKGVPGKYPPLDGNPVVNGRADNVARIVLRGLHGPVEVDGKTFDGQMPSWSQFDDRSLAAVLTYVRASWSNASPPISEALVAAAREETRERKGAWTLAELDSTAPIELKPTAGPHEALSQSAGTPHKPNVK